MASEVCFRRILPVPGRAREGLFTEPTADALLGILDCAVHIAFNPVTMFKITQAGRTSSLSKSPGRNLLRSERAFRYRPSGAVDGPDSKLRGRNLVDLQVDDLCAWRQGPGS